MRCAGDNPFCHRIYRPSFPGLFPSLPCSSLPSQLDIIIHHHNLLFLMFLTILTHFLSQYPPGKTHSWNNSKITNQFVFSGTEGFPQTRSSTGKVPGEEDACPPKDNCPATHILCFSCIFLSGPAPPHRPRNSLCSSFSITNWMGTGVIPSWGLCSLQGSSLDVVWGPKHCLTFCN